MKIRFHNNEFVRSHGRLPSGRGSWAFQISHINDFEGTADVHFSQGGMTLTEAKKAMKPVLMAEAEKLVPGCSRVDVDVLP